MTAVVLRLELEKQIKPLMDAQRFVLVERLMGLDETCGQMQRRADSVLVQETFGTIAFQYWVKDLVVCYSEAAERKRQDRQNLIQLVNETIRYRIEKFRLLSSEEQKTVDIEIAELAGQQQAFDDWNLKLHEIRERSRREAKKKLSYARNVLNALDVESRTKVMDEAVKQKIIKQYDKPMLENIQLFPDKYYKVLEGMKLL